MIIECVNYLSKFKKKLFPIFFLFDRERIFLDRLRNRKIIILAWLVSHRESFFIQVAHNESNYSKGGCISRIQALPVCTKIRRCVVLLGDRYGNVHRPWAKLMRVHWATLWPFERVQCTTRSRFLSKRLKTMRWIAKMRDTRSMTSGNF